MLCLMLLFLLLFCLWGTGQSLALSFLDGREANCKRSEFPIELKSRFLINSNQNMGWDYQMIRISLGEL